MNVQPFPPFENINKFETEYWQTNKIHFVRKTEDG